MATDDDDHARWDRAAPAWQTWWPAIEAAARPVTQRLLELARVRPGARVLDIATGIGEPALTAAARVGPSGRVLATDVSPAMLAIARRRALDKGFANVEWREADIAAFAPDEGAWDAVLCRWGVTSLPDPPGLLHRIRGWLAPGGAFATAVWVEGKKGRPLATLAAATAADLFEGDVPTDAGPDAVPSSQARAYAGHPGADADDDAHALAGLLRDAGFAHVHVEHQAIALAFDTLDDALRYVVDLSPELADRLAARTPGERADWRARVAAGLAPFATPGGGLAIPNVTLLAAGHA